MGADEMIVQSVWELTLSDIICQRINCLLGQYYFLSRSEKYWGYRDEKDRPGSSPQMASLF